MQPQSRRGAGLGNLVVLTRAIQTTSRAFNDFAGAGGDQAANRKMMGID